MLEDVPATLAKLNEATQAWVEYEYNRKLHSEIGEAPIARFLKGPEVTRPSPDSAALRLAFTRTEHRTQRKSDSAVVIAGAASSCPTATAISAVPRSASPVGSHHGPSGGGRTGTVLCRLFPLDKTKNASGLRRPLDNVTAAPVLAAPAGSTIAPLLAKLIDQQAATGLPPAYLPKDEGEDA